MISIIIPRELVQIGKGAFSSCFKLKRIEFAADSKLQTIEKDAFSWSHIECITIPSEVTRISYTVETSEEVTKSSSESTSESFINDMKNELSAKDLEISRLREEISQMKTSAASKLNSKDEEISKLKEENTQLKNGSSKNMKSKNDEISQMKEEISQMKKSTESKLKSKDDEISKLKEENTELKNGSSKNMKSKNDEISQLKEENDLLQTEIKQLKRSSKQKVPKIRKETFLPIKVYTTSEIKNFEVVKLIGKGSTSEVNEVIHKEKLAMKVLDIEIIQKGKSDTKSDTKSDDNDDDYDDEEVLKISIEEVKQLIKQLETLNSLNHPNIVKTFGFYYGNQKRSPFILLERCDSNLKKRIKRLTKEERISAIVNLSSALKEAHSVGIIHGNLKLENILLDEDNNVKLSDFCLCTFIKTDDETLSDSQMTDNMKFKSPEQIQGRKKINEKVDVYAFGVVVFVILTKGEYPEISIDDIENENMASIPRSITKFSRKLIRDCWSFKSRDRPSFEEICDILDGNEEKLI